MKKVSLFILLFLMACLPALAQKKTAAPEPACELKLDQSPELRGFRLGMTQSAVLARLPRITIEKPDKFGLARLRLSTIDSTSLIKTSARDTGVQPDMLAGANEGSAFVIDSAKFPFLKGTRKIEMRFIDGRLSSIQIAYDDQIKWESLDQFTDTISTILNLPKNWRIPSDSDGSSEKELRCQGFVLTANTAGDASDLQSGPELVLQDSAAWQTMSQRQNDTVEKQRKDEEGKRKAFKP